MKTVSHSWESCRHCSTKYYGLCQLMRLCRWEFQLVSFTVSMTKLMKEKKTSWSHVQGNNSHIYPTPLYIIIQIWILPADTVLFRRSIRINCPDINTAFLKCNSRDRFTVNHCFDFESISKTSWKERSQVEVTSQLHVSGESPYTKTVYFEYDWL